VTNGVSPSASSSCSSQNLEVRAKANKLINLLFQIVTSYAPFLYIAVELGGLRVRYGLGLGVRVGYFRARCGSLLLLMLANSTDVL